MTAAEDRIQELIDRERRAWDTADVDLLLSVFHPDMVWPWPRTPHSHDPLDWDLGFGRFDRERWGALWQGLFDTHVLVHNRWTVRSVRVSREGDAGFAVVDVDTLWRDASGREEHWQGRTARGYTLVTGAWKLILHTGALRYGEDGADREPTGP